MRFSLRRFRRKDGRDKLRDAFATYRGYIYRGPCVRCGKDLYHDVSDPRLSWFDLEAGQPEPICKTSTWVNQHGATSTRTHYHAVDPRNQTVFNGPTTYDVPVDLSEPEVERWLST